MLRGIFLSARAMKNQTIRNDVIANNLANINTAGFKKDIALFHSAVDNNNRETTNVQSAIQYNQGTFNQTDRVLDLAIHGEGFFEVETDEGARYTRNGAFLINSEGYLVTSNGDRVAGGIQLPPGKIEVYGNGAVKVNGVSAGRISVVDFEDKSLLEKTGSTLFRAMQGASPKELTIEETNIVSGFIEESNVDVVAEMTNMIEGLKAYEISQKALKSQDEILQMMTTRIGKIG
ncbi:flagellar hook-basal body protein [bacterium]|nr:flagellar hook-basal body protein [bacterium]